MCCSQQHPLLNLLLPTSYLRGIPVLIRQRLQQVKDQLQAWETLATGQLQVSELLVRDQIQPPGLPATEQLQVSVLLVRDQLQAPELPVTKELQT